MTEAAWTIFIGLAVVGWTLATVIEKGLKRIADRIDNQSRILAEIEERLARLK